MNNYDKTHRNVELLFDEFEAKAKKFLEKCRDWDVTDRFVSDLSGVLANKLQTNHEIKAVIEALRSRFWLNFIGMVRESDYNLAEAMLVDKNELIQKYASITSGVAQSGGEEPKIRNNGANLGLNERRKRKSY